MCWCVRCLAYTYIVLILVVWIFVVWILVTIVINAVAQCPESGCGLGSGIYAGMHSRPHTPPHMDTFARPVGSPALLPLLPSNMPVVPPMLLCLTQAGDTSLTAGIQLTVSPSSSEMLSSKSPSVSASISQSPAAHRTEKLRDAYMHDMDAKTINTRLGGALCEPVTDMVQPRCVSAPASPIFRSAPNSPTRPQCGGTPSSHSWCCQSPTAVSRVDAIFSTSVGRRLQFIECEHEEPHSARRRAILARYPEIKQLMKPESWTKYMVAATVCMQIFMAAATLDWGWPAYLTAVYVVGATANHSLLLAIHECSHNLAANRPFWNKVIAILANLPIGVPYCICFTPYHRLHHSSLGDIHDDTDLPSEWEAWAVTQSATCRADHAVRKTVYLFLQIFWYALRPVCTRPELVEFDAWLVVNWTVQLAFNAALVHAGGARALWYLLLCTFLCGGLHPSSGHYLEHVVAREGSADTISYYGVLNYFTYNVGIHACHHDFPNLPWSQLSKVREIAPEFYDKLPVCKSWPGAIARFIFDDSLGLNSRLRRRRKEE